MGRGRKMASTGTTPNNQPERKDDTVKRLMRKSRIVQAVTFAAVILISPFSFVIGIPLGISPHTWLTTWTHWTVIFITAAFFVALFGFEGALDIELKADRISKSASS